MPSIELYGQARLLARTRSVTVAAATVREALRALRELHPELVGTVLQPDGTITPAYAVNLNGLRFCQDLAEALTDADELLIISSLSGG